MEPEQKVHALHGGILKLYCDAVGNPPPKFQWFKEDSPIRGASDRELLKHNVCQDDSGTYRCQIYNDAGESIVSSSASVVVIKGKDFVNAACEYRWCLLSHLFDPVSQSLWSPHLCCTSKCTCYAKNQVDETYVHAHPLGNDVQLNMMKIVFYQLYGSTGIL